MPIAEQTRQAALWFQSKNAAFRESIHGDYLYEPIMNNPILDRSSRLLIACSCRRRNRGGTTRVGPLRSRIEMPERPAGGWSRPFGLPQLLRDPTPVGNKPCGLTVKAPKVPIDAQPAFEPWIRPDSLSSMTAWSARFIAKALMTSLFHMRFRLRCQGEQS